ncbi:hypothetical protein PENSPDRAFT_252466 [Peniophora sp. CONT]|nr:hypothetical protein PENSPDRAFT_252466 [Peniophora sp. CONT]
MSEHPRKGVALTAYSARFGSVNALLFSCACDALEFVVGLCMRHNPGRSSAFNCRFRVPRARTVRDARCAAALCATCRGRHARRGLAQYGGG